MRLLRLLLLAVLAASSACGNKQRDAAMLAVHTRIDAARSSLRGREESLAVIDRSMQGLPRNAPEIEGAVMALAKQRVAVTAARESLTELDAKVQAARGARDPAVLRALDQELDDFGKRLEPVDEMLPRIEKLVAKGAVAAARRARLFDKVLPTGAHVGGAGDGLESALCDYLDGASHLGDLEARVQFDRLVVDAGSGGLDAAGSSAQLDNAAAILRAYGNVVAAEVFCFVRDAEGSRGASDRSLRCASDVARELSQRMPKGPRIDAAEIVSLASFTDVPAPAVAVSLQVTVARTGR